MDSFLVGFFFEISLLVTLSVPLLTLSIVFPFETNETFRLSTRIPAESPDSDSLGISMEIAECNKLDDE